MPKATRTGLGEATLSDQAQLSLYFMGNVELRGVPVDVAESLLGQPKLVALLALLGVPSPGRYVRRDTIAALLWPALDQERARATLRKNLHAVRAALGEAAIRSRGTEDIALDADVVSTDVGRFVAATDEARLAAGLELFRGDLLAGFHQPGCAEFSQWLDGERANVQERAAAAAWALAQRFENDQKLSDAATWARRSVRISGTDERAARRALTMLERLGDRAGALRLYEDFRRRLRAELDLEPSAETVAVADRIRGGTGLD